MNIFILKFPLCSLLKRALPHYNSFYKTALRLISKFYCSCNNTSLNLLISSIISPLLFIYLSLLDWEPIKESALFYLSSKLTLSRVSDGWIRHLCWFKFFLDFFKSSFRFPAKLKQRYRNVSYIPCPNTWTISPLSIFLTTVAHLLQLMSPHGYIIITQRP